MRSPSPIVLLGSVLLPLFWSGSRAAAEGSAVDAGRLRVLGTWASKGTVFSITLAGEELRGEVIAMRKPRPDRKNPDPRLRTRPVIGLQLLSGYRFSRGAWRGKLYDPGSGATYSSHLKVDDDGNLRLRGYVGISLLGKTEVFQPVSACSQRIIEMLRAAEIHDLC